MTERGPLAISVRQVGKVYRLGVLGSGTLRADAARRWARMRGKPDPFSKIGQADHGNQRGDQVWALKDVSFDVHQGEVVGIIGRNGAGKSTILKILSRITAPTSGEVRIKGRLASLLEIGTGFHPELTGRENVFLNGAILGMNRSEIAAKVDAIVDFSGVGQYIDTPVKRYSSGMYLRLAFAVAAHLEASILVVDEVLAVGDIEFQNKCLGKLSDVANAGRTVLFVSHNMAAVSKLCGRGIVLTKGEVTFDGPPVDAVRHYLGAADDELGERINLRGRAARPAEIEIIDGRLARAGVPTATFLSGEAIHVQLELLTRSATNFSIELVLRDANGLPIAFSPSGLAFGVEFDAGPGRSTATCVINGVTLAKGTYYLDVALSESGVRFLDYVESAFRVNVADTHIGPKSWHFDQRRGQGSLLLDATFTHKHG